MNLIPQSRWPRRRLQSRAHGFTMVEIALCLAVIGFAIVAIIGVLPMGMQVQRDNREDTIVNQDGPFFLQALRDGRKDIHYLTQFVERVTIQYRDGRKVEKNPPWEDGAQIVGLLSNPRIEGASDEILRTEAIVRAITGPAIEKGVVNVPETAFKYVLESEIIPVRTIFTNDLPDALRFSLVTNTYDARLTFRYPYVGGTRTGVGRKVFRTLVSNPLRPGERPDEWFFEP